LHQIGLMGQIYVRAEEVLIWLGRDTKGTAEALFDYMIETVPYRRFITEVDHSFNETFALKMPDSKDWLSNCMIVSWN
jgi:hypothetical protein